MKAGRKVRTYSRHQMLNIRSKLMIECDACGGSGKVPSPKGGWVLEDLRDYLRISRRELAARMGISEIYLKHVEQGKRPLTLSMLVQYEDALRQRGEGENGKRDGEVPAQ